MDDWLSTLVLTPEKLISIMREEGVADSGAGNWP